MQNTHRSLYGEIRSSKRQAKQMLALILQWGAIKLLEEDGSETK